ncbi:tyrosine-type recombinase/integrase [Streptomyces sp. NPDC051453]|uniref:tyrosine-type recombinase/integrase n=1 Tax=Streptomyces sp. NPDC051453 TaxID=3154941 RepID=UPI003441B1C7
MCSVLGNDVARAGPSSVCPKAKKSRRTPVLTPEQVELFQCLCKGRRPTDLHCTGGWGAALGVVHAHRWKPALDAVDAAGLTKRPRIHDLRHAHASWLIAGRVPLPVIQARLGRASIATTVDRYGHRQLHTHDEPSPMTGVWARLHRASKGSDCSRPWRA